MKLHGGLNSAMILATLSSKHKCFNYCWKGEQHDKKPRGITTKIEFSIKKVQLCSFCCSRTLCFSIPTINTSIVGPKCFWMSWLMRKKNTLQSFYLVMNAICRKVYCVVILTFEKQYSMEVWYLSPLNCCNKSKWNCLNHVQYPELIQQSKIIFDRKYASTACY